MGSKREEERNEKIIRGLMKLPPNRRCINCNSLGPQYVCTNFWTFVCMICSGIHREFTHRVKSVSMSKFTSLEVEALQNGGNQRAREIYLKDWDPQRQRLPNSSNVDKVRDFIKAVYVDQKYVGQNKSDKPSGETQSESNIGEETRRASSYHSYSQSPPYDFQYEDRLNRKKGGPNARKPGAGLFERKTVSFVYSPGRFSDHMYEDRFANEGSSSRASDYSVSSGGGDPFRSAPQSPNLMNDKGLLGPTVDISKKTVDGLQHQGTSTHPEASSKGDADRVALPCPQRTVSSGSFGNNPVSLQSSGSSSLFDAFSEHNQSAATPQKNVPTFPAFPPSSTETSVTVNLFEISEGMPVTNSGQGIDLFQEPTGSVSSPSSSSNYFNEISQTFSKPSSVPSVDQKLPGPSDPSDEGWATFDLPQHNTSMTVAQDIAVSGTHSEAEFSFTNTLLSSGAELQWPAFQSPSGGGLGLSVSNPWDEHVQNFDIPANKSDDKPWKAFEGDNDHHPFVGFQQQPGLQVYQNSFSVTGDQYLGQNISEGLGADRSHKLASEGDLLPTSSSHIASGLSFNQPILHSMSETALIRQKSGNPFDFDSEREASDEFFGMGGLQEALPSVPLPSSPYAGGINESWFPSSPVASQGTVPYVMAAPSSPQLPSVPTNGPVASVGGNPFA